MTDSIGGGHYTYRLAAPPRAYVCAGHYTGVAYGHLFGTMCGPARHGAR